MGINTDDCCGGMMLRVLPRTTINCGGLAASQQIFIPIAQHIEASGFTEVDLLVRFHTAQLAAGTAVLAAVYSDGWDFDDPSINFGPPGGVALAMGQPGVVQVTNATTFPYYQLAQLGGAQTTAPFGRLLNVGVLATMPAAVGNLNFTLSLDLALKGGGAGAMPMSPNTFRGYRIM
jgi:hypothetical protein